MDYVAPDILTGLYLFVERFFEDIWRKVKTLQRKKTLPKSGTKLTGQVPNFSSAYESIKQQMGVCSSNMHSTRISCVLRPWTEDLKSINRRLCYGIYRAMKLRKLMDSDRLQKSTPVIRECQDWWVRKSTFTYEGGATPGPRA